MKKWVTSLLFGILLILVLLTIIKYLSYCQNIYRNEGFRGRISRRHWRRRWLPRWYSYNTFNPYYEYPYYNYQWWLPSWAYSWYNPYPAYY